MLQTTSHPNPEKNTMVENVSLAIAPGQTTSAGVAEEQFFQSFERLLLALSRQFLNLTIDRVDQEVGVALTRIRRLFLLDSFCLATSSPEKGQWTVTHVSYEQGMENLGNVKLGQIVTVPALDGLPANDSDGGRWTKPSPRSCAIPIHVARSARYLLIASKVRGQSDGDANKISRLRLLGEILANALIRHHQETALHDATREVERLQKKSVFQVEYVDSEPIPSQSHNEIVGQSQIVARTLALIEQVAPTDSTVLIYGETGTGKELIANDIHKLSKRRQKQMVKVNCASLPAALVESELFGRERGAYTGALTRQAGRFELADGGTIFLDEIAEMSLELQAKLLRVLQEGQFERLGGTKTIQVDVRVIAATNRNLGEEVRKGTFREDLFYRLNVFQIVVPPLRERVEDIPLLVWTFVNEFAEKMGKRFNKISKQDMAALQIYHWPGNVRELRNVIEHAAIVNTGDTLQIRVPEKDLQESPGMRTLEEYEIMHIREALRLTGGRIKGERGAARLLGLNPSTLYSRMQKLGIGNRSGKDDMSS